MWDARHQTECGSPSIASLPSLSPVCRLSPSPFFRSGIWGKKKKKKGKMKTSNLYKGSSNSKIVSVTVKMLFSLKIGLRASLALQSLAESISIKSFWSTHIHFPRKQSLSKLRAGHNRPYLFLVELWTLLKVMHKCHSITPSWIEQH